MKKFFSLLILITVSCQTTSRKPISAEKMALILKDMHLIQSYLYEQRLPQEERIKKSNQFYHSILSRYQVTKEEFYESMNYYSQNVQAFDSIYKIVLEKTSNPNQN